MLVRAGLHGPGVGEGRRSSTRSSRTASATAARTTTRRPATVRYDDPVLQPRLGHAARGLLPQLRRRADAAARGASARPRPPTARRSSSRAAATTSAATSRASTSSSTTSRRWASTRSTSTRSSTPARTTRTTRRTTPRSTRLRHPEGLGQPRQARERARDPRDPRRRVQPHVSDSPIFDRYDHYPTRRRLRVGHLAVSRSWFAFTDAVGPAAGTCVSSAGNATRRPTTAGSASTRSRSSTSRSAAVQAVLPDRAPNASPSSWLKAGAAAGGWTSRATPSSRRATGRRSAPSSRRHEPRRADGQRDVAEGLDAAADDPRRPPRHDDELPAPRRGHRVPGARARSTPRASPTAGGSISPSGVPRPGWPRIREDYPDAAYYSLMNLLDSHDTERLLWTLTPGAETTAAREQRRRQPGRGQGARAARVADPVHRPRRADRVLRRRGRRHGRRRSRRPPHLPVGRPRRLARHRAVRDHYTALAALRRDVPALTDGDFRAAPRRRCRRRRGLRPQDHRPARPSSCSTAPRRRRRSTSRSPATCRTGSRSRPASRWQRRPGSATVGRRRGRRHGPGAGRARARRRGQSTSDRMPAATGVADHDGGPARSPSPGPRSPGRAPTTSGSSPSPVAAHEGHVERRSRHRASTTRDLRNGSPRLRAWSRPSTPPATRARTSNEVTAIAAVPDRLGEPPVAATPRSPDQPDRPHDDLRPGLDRRAHRRSPAPTSASWRRSGFGARRLQPGDERRVDVGGCRVQRPGRQQLRVPGARSGPSTTGAFDYVFRYSTDQRRDLAVRGPRRPDRRRAPATGPGCPHGQRAARHDRARGARRSSTSTTGRAACIELAWDASATRRCTATRSTVRGRRLVASSYTTLALVTATSYTRRLRSRAARRTGTVVRSVDAVVQPSPAPSNEVSQAAEPKLVR